MIYLSGLYTKEWYLAKDSEEDQFGGGEMTLRLDRQNNSQVKSHGEKSK